MGLDVYFMQGFATVVDNARQFSPVFSISLSLSLWAVVLNKY